MTAPTHPRTGVPSGPDVPPAAKRPDAGPSPGDLAWFDYDLPAERIAQVPVEPRDSARLLVDRLHAPGGPRVDHRRVADLADEVGPGDVVVVNDTRVIPARLLLRRATGGKVEVLVLEPTGRHREWQALVGAGRRVEPGTELHHDGEVVAVVGEQLGDGRRLVTLLADDLVERVGRVPLPPYIHAELGDAERYQTVFARHPGSVAAPTAGLHLTPALLERLAAAGAEVVPVELRVGLGTFRPVTAERVAEHRMHGEWYRVEPEVWDRIRSARRVLAVGTTVVRTLETAAATGELTGTSELFIRRGFAFQVVDRLLTNFHVPRSSLLVLLDAFVGPRWKELYRTALDHRPEGEEPYRFLSFGDAMLIERRDEPVGEETA